VRVTGRGQGGRNQELALRFALAAADRRLAGPWAFLAAGTDGRDGPTDAAGGVSDDTTPARARSRGLDLEAALADNDSHAALRALGDLVVTGPTGTNVADLAVFVRG
jgi:hydroxypyruvate reductase